jgi:acetyl-CoA carboxylase carboxyltransferase component
MSGYGQVSTAYANQPRASGRPARRIRKEKKMKLTFKQRIRNWLNDDSDIEEDILSSGQTIEASRLDSDGMRIQIYKASGGYVVETRNYDRRTDRHNNTMHVIREDQDLGDALGKIVMMEALRG